MRAHRKVLKKKFALNIGPQLTVHIGVKESVFTVNLHTCSQTDWRCNRHFPRILASTLIRALVAANAKPFFFHCSFAALQEGKFFM